MSEAVVAFRVTAQKDTVPWSWGSVLWGNMQMGFVWLVENYRTGFANLSAASGGDLGAPAGPCSWSQPLLSLAPSETWELQSQHQHNSQFVISSSVPSKQAQWTCCVWSRKHKLLFFIPMRQNIRKMQLALIQKFIQAQLCHCAHTEIPL